MRKNYKIVKIISYVTRTHLTSNKFFIIKIISGFGQSFFDQKCQYRLIFVRVSKKF
jgi:hypothetical protein